MRRDFTYVADLVEAICRLIPLSPREGEPLATATDTLSPAAPWRVVNIAGGNPVGLLDFVETVENALGRKAIRNMLPMQKGDVVETFADASLLQALSGFLPSVTVEEGVRAFVDWYRSDYQALLRGGTTGV